MSTLDSGQIIKTVFNPSSESLNVTALDGGSGAVVSTYAIAYTSINGSGGAVYEIVASTSADINNIVINEQTGAALNFYTGGAGSEVVLFIIPPGHDTPIPAFIESGTRLSVRAVGASAPSSGSLYFTFIGD